MYRYLLAILIVVCSSYRIPPDISTDRLVMKAAESQLPIYMAKIQPGHEKDFGFTDKDNLENCSVAKPYRLITFITDFYDRELTENINYIDIKNQWRVPVTLNGEHRVLLTVDGNPGNFTVSGMGGAELAKELEFKSSGVNDTDEFYLLRIYPLAIDLFVAGHENSFVDAEFIPMAAARSAVPAFNDKKSYTLDEVQQIVKKAVAAKAQPQKKEPAKKKTTKKRPAKK